MVAILYERGQPSQEIQFGTNISDVVLQTARLIFHAESLFFGIAEVPNDLHNQMITIYLQQISRSLLLELLVSF
jgi:hypothetical protein